MFWCSYQRGTADTGHTKACGATRSGLAQPRSRRRCATHKDVGGDAHDNANLGSNGVLANFQLAAGQRSPSRSPRFWRYLEKLSMLLKPRSSSSLSMAASIEKPPFTKLHTQLKDYHSIQYTTRPKVDAR
ncbi:hypothetical protein PC123_g5665 [Phytophthora cactorum]|nr:hypothetical protein PC120_g15537 [Phytophthora cactorum]KAG4059373.1 hypothetical protein PC123_g5665 [Phytophthora cactorum]